MSVSQYLNRWFSVFLLVFISHVLHAQEAPDFVSKDLIDAVFEGGNAGYTDYFEQNLDFPKNSYKDQIEGLLLFKFTIDTEKPDIEVRFFTKLDERIEAGIKATVQATRSKWKFKIPGKYTVYQPIIFSLLPYYPQTLEGDLPPLPVALPFKYQQLFVLIKSKRIPEDFDLENASEEEASERIKTMYIRTQAAYEKSLAAGKTEIAYQLLNKLIRYNPLKKEYLMKRIQLEKALEVNDYQVYDAHLLNDFVATYKPLDSYDTNRAYFAGSQKVDLEEGKNTVNTFEKLYEGGHTAFSKHLMVYFQVPNAQYLSKTDGVLLVEIKSDAEGNVSTRLLNSFDSPVSNGLEKALKFMDFNWRPTQKPFYKIIPFFIAPNEPIGQTLRLVLDDYQVLKQTLFLDPIQVSGLHSQTVFDEVDPLGLDKEALKENSNLYGLYLVSIGKYDALIKEGKTKKAAQALNTAIRLNPFNIDLIEKRLALDDKKTKAKYAKYDQALLELLKSLK